MDSILAFIFGLGGFLIIENLVLFFIYIANKSWNIPVTILRFTGNKQRPMIFHRKAKKWLVNHVPKLRIKGYKDVLYDYKNENYYPTNGKHGGLILWEFEDGLLVPAIPYKVKKKLSPEEQATIRKFKDIMMSYKIVNFDFDETLYHSLMLRAIDDVDLEALADEIVRIKSQYAPTWQEWLKQYSWLIMWVLLGMIILVSVVLFFDKAPEIMAQCANAAVENSKTVFESLAKGMASANAPGG